MLPAVRRLRWPAERLAAERERRLRELLSWSAEHSSFWRERLSGIDIAGFTEADLPTLPVLTKAELMDNFDEVLTRPSLNLDRLGRHIDTLKRDSYIDDEYRVIATSGTGGTRVVFAYDSAEWVTFVLLATRWIGRDGQPDRYGGPTGTLFAANSTHVSGALHAFFTGADGNSVAHLPATLPLPAIVAGLNAAQPTVLQGYPSAVELLALEAMAGRLAISPISVRTCGEQCTAEARAAAREAWGVEIYDYWGSSEGVLAQRSCSPISTTGPSRSSATDHRCVDAARRSLRVRLRASAHHGHPRTE
jgi:phenylacetate-coenzyme A ligase PaaK-like adenylate-forming protein